MKKIKFLFLALMSVVAVSCEDLKEAFEFTLPYESTVTVPPTLGINTPLDILTPDIQTNAESVFSQQGTSKDLIESIKVAELKLKINAPSTQKFDFLKSVELTISASGLSDLKLASKDNIADGLTELTLDLPQNNLVEYLKKDKFKIKASIVTDRTITQEVQIGVSTKFTVRANLL